MKGKEFIVDSVLSSSHPHPFLWTPTQCLYISAHPRIEHRTITSGEPVNVHVDKITLYPLLTVCQLKNIQV